MSDPTNDKFAAEAKAKWGETEAYRESQRRVKKMGAEGLALVLAEQAAVAKELAEHIGTDPSSPEVQALIARHFDGLRAFYEPTAELYRGLADMYVTDERFRNQYSQVHPDLADFLSKGMKVFADGMEKDERTS